MPRFTCERCGATFSLPQSVLDRYPGWIPKLCRRCRQGKGAAGGPSRRSASSQPARARSGDLLTLAEVLARYDGGPKTGVFTDGSAVPNPGPGGWGAVYVVGDQVIDQAYGHEPDTTNNRMELTALIAGCDLVPAGTTATLYTDSRLVARTVNEWAAGWERRGWKRKSGPVENLDLVRAAYTRVRSRREVTVEWIAGHAGHRWNEYADSLANAWRRAQL